MLRNALIANFAIGAFLHQSEKWYKYSRSQGGYGMRYLALNYNFFNRRCEQINADYADVNQDLIVALSALSVAIFLLDVYSTELR